MAGTSCDISSVMTSAANNYNTRLDLSVRIKLVSAPKSHKIEYVPIHTIREITRLATMLVIYYYAEIKIPMQSICEQTGSNPSQRKFVEGERVYRAANAKPVEVNNANISLLLFCTSTSKFVIQFISNVRKKLLHVIRSNFTSYSNSTVCNVFSHFSLY